jgi:hypothetical protein
MPKVRPAPTPQDGTPSFDLKELTTLVLSKPWLGRLQTTVGMVSPKHIMGLEVCHSRDQDSSHRTERRLFQAL